MEYLNKFHHIFKKKLVYQITYMLWVVPKVLLRIKSTPVLQVFQVKYQISIVRNTNKFITTYYNKYYSKIIIKYTPHFLEKESIYILQRNIGDI